MACRKSEEQNLPQNQNLRNFGEICRSREEQMAEVVSCLLRRHCGTADYVFVAATQKQSKACKQREVQRHNVFKPGEIVNGGSAVKLSVMQLPYGYRLFSAGCRPVKHFCAVASYNIRNGGERW